MTMRGWSLLLIEYRTLLALLVFFHSGASTASAFLSLWLVLSVLAMMVRFDEVYARYVISRRFGHPAVLAGRAIQVMDILEAVRPAMERSFLDPEAVYQVHVRYALGEVSFLDGVRRLMRFPIFLRFRVRLGPRGFWAFLATTAALSVPSLLLVEALYAVLWPVHELWRFRGLRQRYWNAYVFMLNHGGPDREAP